MTQPQRSRTLVALLLAVSVLGFLTDASAQSNSAEYRNAFATATREAARRVLPSVVCVEIIGVAQTNTGRRRASEVEQDAPTCGVIVDPDGFIIASDIVVRRPSASILVVLPDSTRLAAKVVAKDSHRGLVLLKVNPESPLPAISFPREIDLPVGATVIGVGRYGKDNSPIMTSGILSATNRLEGTMLQFDARVSPAFYGGPLVDLYGNVIGIQVPAIASGGAPDKTSWYDSGIAFAVPTTVIAAKLDRLKNGDEIKKGLIGIVPKTSDPYAEGTRLAAVRSRSPAEKAGIEPGDEVIAVNEQPVTMFQQVREALGPFDAGETIKLTLRRDGETREVEVLLADSIPPLQPQRLGVWAVQRDAAADEGEASGDEPDDDRGDGEPATEIVVRGVVPGSAAEGTLQDEDVLLTFDGRDVSDLASLRRLLVTAVKDEPVELSLRRDGELQSVEITPTSVASAAFSATLDDWKDNKPEEAWEIERLRLPDVTNEAAYVAPKAPVAGQSVGLAMMAMILPADKRDPEKLLQTYKDLASRYGVVICAIASEDSKRWQPKEVDVVSRLVTLLAQRVEIDSSAISIVAPGVIKNLPASPADSMVIAIALSDRQNFSGIAVSNETRPPAVKLRENEPDRSLQVYLPIDSLDDGPPWAAPLVATGYPIVLGGDTELKDLLRWARLLQTI